MPGKSEIHQAEASMPRPSSTITPQAGCGGGMPTPRKLRVASRMMALPTCRLASTSKEGTRLGSTCRPMMRAGEHPAMRASLI